MSLPCPACGGSAAKHPAGGFIRPVRSPIEGQAEHREIVIDLLSSLVAAVSLLKNGSKKAAPSNRMFDQMIADYERSIERGRAVMKEVSHD